MTEEKKLNTMAQVTVKLAVTISQSWGKDSTIGLVDAQARVEAENTVRNLIIENPGKFTLIEKPEVSIIITRR